MLGAKVNWPQLHEARFLKARRVAAARLALGYLRATWIIEHGKDRSLTDKFFEVKRKHHYVWANYLRRWSVDGINAYQSTKKGLVVPHGIRGIAMEIDLYRLTTLSNFDVYMIKLASSKSVPHLHRLHMNCLSGFLAFQSIKEIYEASGKKHKDADRAILAMESKLLEDLHASHESSVAEIFDNLARGCIQVLYKNSNFCDFMCFIGHQFARTKTFRDRAVQAFVRSSDDHERVALSMENSWWFYSYMLGMNLGADLYINRLEYTHSLLEASGELEFITSDQPVINVHEQVWRSDYSEARYIDYYYPVSPKYAYIVTSSDSFTGGVVKVGDDVVADLNKKISASAASIIVGSSPGSIRPLISIINSKRR